MESTNNNNNQMFLCEFKELRKELSAVKKRIVQLEKSNEKQQDRIDILERDNHTLKTQLNNLSGNAEGASSLKRKRTDQNEVYEEEIESKSTSASASLCKKKTKTNNNDDDEEAAVLPQRDNGDSFDSLSDDLLHKIVEFDGNCYSVFGLINKRCKNIYDVKEYKLKKQTCVIRCGTVDMILQHYLQQRKEETLDEFNFTAYAVIYYNRLDVIDWIIRLGDFRLLQCACSHAAAYGRINILTKVFIKCNLTMLDNILNDTFLCHNAAYNGQLETLKWLRKYGAKWDEDTFYAAREKGHDEILQYLRAEGCPKPPENTDQSSGSEQTGKLTQDEFQLPTRVK